MRHLEPLEGTDPARIGPYALLGRLGAGGMGTVYLGRSPGGRTVAVKLVRPDLAADPAFRDRFRAEVAAARAASGAFTAPVVDADPGGRVPWMATVYVPGVSLGRAVALGGPLPEPALRALAAGAAESLAAIHAAGLTHRDLKPGNVLLALDGPHIIDFGIARSVDGTALTATGTILGTPAYMSPEQAAGGPVGPPSDVFSLGATLVFAARGEGPFDGGGGQPADILRRVVREEPDLSAVPEGLRLLIAACRAKRPEDRPGPRQVVEFFGQGAVPVGAGAWLPPALTAAVEEAAAVMAPSATPAAPPPAAGPPPPVTPPTPVPPPGEPGRRTLLTLGLAGGAVALSAGGTGLGLWLGRPDAPSDPKAPAARAPGLTDPARPLGTGSGAEPLWTAAVSEPLVQILGRGETVLALSAKNIWAFDAAGRRRWGPVAHLPDTAGGAGEGLVAALGDGMAYAVMRTGVNELGRALRAVRLDTGATAWTVPLPYDTAFRVLVAGMLDDRVYVTGTAASSSLTPQRGRVSGSGPFVWSVDPAERTGWHVVLADPDTRHLQGDLFVPSSGTRLFWSSRNTDGSAQKIAALDVRTRKPAWERPSPGAATSLTDLAVQGGRHGHWRDGPHSSAGGLFLHVTDRLYGVDPADGRVVWTSPPAPLKGVVASPDGRTVFASGFEGLSVVVYALDARTGAVRWAGSIPGATGSLPVLQTADGTVYVAFGGRLHALNADNGEVRWSYAFSTVLDHRPPRAFWAGGGRVYVMGTKGLVALGAGGR
ncbi:PQQ-binding-like beta-propeller repeat protein [Streptomyces sp. CC77]|uniref:serine/threonine-protein kinase n=1 Tax=Streptomyces sp. CC77 TaxID=1906739 RepID=UPI0008DCCF57|nr:PQQ-binding-like beta-propeller repeat protein [Streptomyces sp. CC77]OII59967.1 hypothetical protein BJP39_11315 [Streptomyces sp. CC77]